MAKTPAERQGPPRMPNNILLKLFLFTILLFVLPVLSFFVSKNLLSSSKNPDIYGGLIAVVIANLVLLLYICLIFKDEDEMPSSKGAKKVKVDEAEDSKEKESAKINRIVEYLIVYPYTLYTAHMKINLTIVRELLIVYKNENNLNGSILRETCEKIKNSTDKNSKRSSVTSKVNNSQLAPNCWNLLIQINKNASSTFSDKSLFLCTAKVVLHCAKIIEDRQKELSMGQYDLEKIVANLLTKLTEGFKQPINEEEDNCDIIKLVEFFFERLHKHFNSLEFGLRRMSLVDASTIDDPFIDVNFQGLCADNLKDSTLKQLALVGLESLCRLMLIFQKGSIEKVIEKMHQFHGSSSHVPHFISSICKLEFWSPFEWNFWKCIGALEIYKDYLEFFRKRCRLTLSPPLKISELNVKILCIILASGQLTEQILIMLEVKAFDDEIIGACLSVLIKEDSSKFTSRIRTIIDKVPKQDISTSGLKTLLASLDGLRNGLFHLIRLDEMVLLFISLNECFLRINFDTRFYVSWTSCLIKAALEHRKAPNIPTLLKVSVYGLMERYNDIAEDVKPKVKKIILQSISASGDCELLDECVNYFNDSLYSILTASGFNLSLDYFYELSTLVFSAPDLDDNLLTQWIKILSFQVHVNGKCFILNDLSKLQSLAELIACEIFDPIKSDQYLESIFTRMKEIGCDQDSIMLCKELIHFKHPKKNFSAGNYLFKDLNVQNAVDLIKSYQQTQRFNLNNFSFKNVNDSGNCISSKLFAHVLNLSLIHLSSKDFNQFLQEFNGSMAYRMKSLFFNTNLTSSNPEIYKLNVLYQQGLFIDALKIGYEKLKLSMKSVTVGIEKTFDTVELIVYLHRLSVSTQNLSEARYFLKQLFQLADSAKSENIKELAKGLESDLSVLMGNALNFMDYSKCESILKSSAYEMFCFGYNNLIALNKIRGQIKAEIQFQNFVACNGIRIKSSTESRTSSLLLQSMKQLRDAQSLKLTYFISEWAKISLFLMMNKSFQVPCDSELLELFELSRNPSFEGNFSNIKLAGSIGLLHDQFLSILWILVVTADSKLLMFGASLNMKSFTSKMQRIHEICAQNTESLRNTTEISKDSEKKANWWKLRRSLDAELIGLCNELNDDMFSGFSDLLIPNSNSSSNSRSFHKKLNELIKELFNDQVQFTEVFTNQLVQLGKFPSRINVENLVKMIKFALNSYELNFSNVEIDSIVFQIRKCFENFIYSNLLISANNLINLILDKDLNVLPFESFNLFNKFTFKRTPIIMNNNEKEMKGSEETLRKVFYILNPSGDLHQTQERFEQIFRNQPDWTGVIGRKPTADEFLSGFCGGIYDLFIYFGHSGGEIYAPLKELKSKWAQRNASSALLIGCSSGKIKSNGIFPAESSIFHYLEQKSPMILANLWDVTDKDIDIYIKSVLEDSDLLLPVTSENILIETTANNSTIIEKAQLNRQRCYLKALNGYAPIIYGLIK